ncbi:hypothetical protein CLV63_109146 [Murinocardiopsis flavida]|uniref:Tetratricopeptide repeat protein n=1 Tax=Murinocardiopsis flavida TaxID=645275 RepID=A0A2P8DIU2_9ACTN|nr:hypothetical protein [Murinocardiopsis flavida]PSK97143.1 hypothetical protein CLV63_109146 [Murinocardiopsis flavida]
MGKHGQPLNGPDLQVRLHAAMNNPEDLAALVLGGLAAAAGTDPAVGAPSSGPLPSGPLSPGSLPAGPPPIGPSSAGPEVLWAAERAYRIDDDRHRGVVVYTAALRACAEYRKAEKLLRAHQKRYGANADVWFGLAALAARRGNDTDVRVSLDNALRHDPDHAESLTWGYQYIRHVRDQARGSGEAAAEEWLGQYTKRSWRATLMLADRSLDRGDLNTAEDRYAHACGLAPRNTEMLMGCARGLADRGYLQECANLVLRVWKASMGPRPMVHAVEALLRAGEAGQASMAMTRLRGLQLDGPEQRIAEGLGERVRAACVSAGI